MLLQPSHSICCYTRPAAAQALTAGTCSSMLMVRMCTASYFCFLWIKHLFLYPHQPQNFTAGLFLVARWTLAEVHLPIQTSWQANCSLQELHKSCRSSQSRHLPFPSCVCLHCRPHTQLRHQQQLMVKAYCPQQLNTCVVPPHCHSCA